MLGAQQALGGAHDAHVVPHEAPQLVPVVGDDHVLVGIGDLAGVPAGQRLRQLGGVQLGEHVLRRRTGVHEALQQGIAGHAVGAVQAGEAGLADGIEVRHVGQAMLVHQHAAAGVVRRRHHRDGLAGDVDAEVQAAFVDRGEVLLDERRRLVADVQVHAVDTQALHLVVDGPRHHIAGRQLGTLVEARHEALAIGQPEQRALATQRLGDQEILGLRVVQAGRMELVEFQVADPATGAPGHGDAVAGVAVRIAGVQVDLGGTAAGQHHETRREGVHLAGRAVQYVGAQAAPPRPAELVLGDQVDRHALVQQLDVRPLARLVQQGIEDRGAGGVGGMNDAPVTVPALAGEVEAEAIVLVGRFLAGKGHALGDQPFDGGTTVLDGEAHRVRPAQPGAGDQRVLHMGIHCVGVIQHGGHAALGVGGRAIVQLPLAEHRDAQVVRQGEGQGEAGGAAADDQYVVPEMLAHEVNPAK